MHQFIQRCIKLMKILAEGLLVCLIVYGVAIPIGALIPRSDHTENEYTSSFIYLIDNGFHVEICLPAGRAPELITSSMEEVIPNSAEPYIYCFGWGDRYFYPGTPTISDLELFPTLEALFLPTPGAIGISWYGNRLIEGDQVRKIAVSEEQVDRLYQFLLSYLYTSQVRDLSLIPLDNQNISSGYEKILFFEAKGTYSLFFTCNNWTNKALRAAGIPTHLWTPTVWGVGN